LPGDYYGNSINVASKLGDDTAGPGEFLIEEDAQIEEDLKKRMERAGFRFRKTTVANQGRPVGSSNSLAGTCSKDSRCITMGDPQPLRIFYPELAGLAGHPPGDDLGCDDLLHGARRPG
jgi:hypothetical protein